MDSYFIRLYGRGPDSIAGVEELIVGRGTRRKLIFRIRLEGPARRQ